VFDFAIAGPTDALTALPVCRIRFCEMHNAVCCAHGRQRPRGAMLRFAPMEGLVVALVLEYLPSRDVVRLAALRRDTWREGRVGTCACRRRSGRTLRVCSTAATLWNAACAAAAREHTFLDAPPAAAQHCGCYWRLLYRESFSVGGSGFVATARCALECALGDDSGCDGDGGGGAQQLCARTARAALRAGRSRRALRFLDSKLLDECCPGRWDRPPIDAERVRVLLLQGADPGTAARSAPRAAPPAPPFLRGIARGPRLACGCLVAGLLKCSTPLHYAAIYASERAVRLLLAAGAECSLRRSVLNLVCCRCPLLRAGPPLLALVPPPPPSHCASLLAAGRGRRRCSTPARITHRSGAR
jgi:hypothetical protein